jgi:hypothetical protein
VVNLKGTYYQVSNNTILNSFANGINVNIQIFKTQAYIFIYLFFVNSLIT